MAETDMKKKAHLIFIPSPSAGHIFSALEFANLLINRFNHLSITVLTTKFRSTTSAPSHTTPVLSSQLQIQLIDVPEPELPAQELGLKARGIVITALIESLIPQVKANVQNILSSYPKSDTNPVVVLVLDFLCFSLIHVGEELGIPSYLYVTSNAGFLSFMLSLQNRQIDDVFDFSDPDQFLPGFSNLVPSRVLPDLAFSKDGGYVSCHRLAQSFKDTKGIIINTFSGLEQYAIDALLSDNGKTKTPPIYAVGPLIDLKGQQHNPNLDQSQDDKILKWLDEQPDSSVIFLCFGSRGSFSPSQTREIALALQSSGIKFLWATSASSPTEVDERSLPEGFIEWIEEGNGMICEWAPQVEILAHKAIGGFVSHCGWNSILESLWFGVPILTWPIYAEQQLNAFRMVKEFGLAVELKLDYRSGSDLVMADEIEKGLKQLMDRENVVHKKVQEMKGMARKAVLNGGSSFISIGELMDNMIGSK